METDVATEPLQWPRGSQGMAVRIRDKNWAETPLGPITRWPQSLKTVVDLMLASPSMMSLVWGAEAIHLYNDSFTALLREHHTTSLGKSAFETFARSRGVFAADIAAGMAGSSARLLAQRYPVLRNGRLQDAWFDVDYAPVHDETGSVAGVIWTLKETTTRVLAERALRESEARHRLLLGAWAQAIWETDPNGVVVADSPSWRAHTGQTLEEWLGYGWLDAIHPNDRAYAERQWREAIAARGLVDAEFRLRAPDGGWRWTNVRAAPVIGGDGQIEKWAGINIDIDVRKRAEAALAESEELRRLAVESGGMGTWRWDLREKVIWGDQAFLALWGFPPSNASRHLSDFTDRMSPHGQAEMGDMVTRAIEAGEVFDGQLAVVSGPTSGRWVRWRGRAESQRPWIVNGVSFDVIEQRARDERLRESEERQTFLLKLGDSMRAADDADEVIAIAARLLGERLAASRIVFAEIDEAAGVANIRPGWTADGAQQHPAVLRLADFGGPLLDDLKAGRVVRYDEVGAPPYARSDLAALAAIGIQAGLSVPLLVGGRFVVNLNVHQHEPRRWSESEIMLVEQVAERIWAAVQRARAEASLRESKQALAADLAGTSLLADLSARLVREESLGAIYEEILAAADVTPVSSSSWS